MKRTVFRLHIDTSRSDSSIVRIETDYKTITKRIDGLATAEKILAALSALLQDHDLSLVNLTHISVSRGPGSYTGLRVTAAIAQIMGLLLSVPVNGKSADIPLDLVYE